MKQDKETEFDTVRETARALNLSETTVYRHIAIGNLRAAKIGRTLRIPRSERERLRRCEAALS